jgi:hypothetical protein
VDRSLYPLHGRRDGVPLVRLQIQLPHSRQRGLCFVQTLLADHA